MADGMQVMWFVQPAVAAVAPALGLVPADAVQGTRNPSSDAQFEALCAGRTDMVVTAMDNVMDWNLRPGPQDFCIVAQVERTTPLQLIARAGLHTLEELRGATVLVDAPANGFVVALRTLLADATLHAVDYTLRPAGGVQERWDALLAGRGDCTLLGPPFDAVALRAGFAALACVQQSYPAFPGQGLVLRKAALDALRPRLAPWLRGLQAASDRMSSGNPAVFQALVDAGYPPGAVAAQIALRPPSLVPDREGVELLIDQRRRLGLEGAVAGYANLVDLSMLDALAAQALPGVP